MCASALQEDVYKTRLMFNTPTKKWFPVDISIFSIVFYIYASSDSYVLFLSTFLMSFALTHDILYRCRYQTRNSYLFSGSSLDGCLHILLQKFLGNRVDICLFFFGDKLNFSILSDDNGFFFLR
jgi:hypothetical protein